MASETASDGVGRKKKTSTRIPGKAPALTRRGTSGRRRLAATSRDTGGWRRTAAPDASPAEGGAVPDPAAPRQQEPALASVQAAASRD